MSCFKRHREVICKHCVSRCGRFDAFLFFFLSSRNLFWIVTRCRVQDSRTLVISIPYNPVKKLLNDLSASWASTPYSTFVSSRSARVCFRGFYDLTRGPPLLRIISSPLNLRPERNREKPAVYSKVRVVSRMQSIAIYSRHRYP